MRRLQDTGDTALVGGISLALGSRGRAQPEIRAAEAELDVLGIEREAQGLALYSTLVDAHGRYTIAREEVARLQDEVLLEWAQLQSERIAALQQQLDVALDAHRALIEIQRLTGQTMVAAATSGDSIP